MRFIVAAIAAVVALIIVGSIAVALIKALFGLAFYLLIGAVVVGGGIYLYGRVRRGLTSGRYRRLTR